MGTLNNVMSQLAHNMDFDKLVTIGVDDDEPSITFGALELLVYKGHETMGGTKVGPNCLDPPPPNGQCGSIKFYTFSTNELNF